MARVKNKLTALGIRKAGPGIMQDGGGLMLHRSEDSGRWVFRYSIAGRRRDMGLGTLDEVSLADARKARDRWAMVLSEGRDPIAERERQREELAQEHRKLDPTFEEWTHQVFEGMKAGLRADGSRGRWMSPMTHHVFPKIGSRRMSSINQIDIADCLRPIWKTKHPTAVKALRRINIVFKKGRLTGLEVDPFVVEAARHLLGEVRHVSTHIESTPWRRIPAVFEELDGRGYSGACLRWMILTAVRGEAGRGARFSEIDGNVWTVPLDRVKGLEGHVQDFRVPLSSAALELLAELRNGAHDDFLFPSSRGGYLTENSLVKLLNSIGERGRPHGFRTSFRSWVQDHEAASFEVAETALGHKVGSQVERTYARSDLLDRRRVLMERWAQFVTRREADGVVMLRGA